MKTGRGIGSESLRKVSHSLDRVRVKIEAVHSYQWNLGES